MNCNELYGFDGWIYNEQGRCAGFREYMVTNTSLADLGAQAFEIHLDGLSQASFGQQDN